MTHQADRAKIVAQILTDNGHPVSSPDEGTLDDVEQERWNVCLQIAQALDETKTSTPIAEVVIADLRAGNLAAQGEEEARCCSTYCLTTSSDTPPVETAK